MTVQELLTIIREDYLDDSAESYLWSDAQLLRYLAEAEHQACNRANLIYDDTTPEIARISLINNKATYPISQLINVVESANIDGTACIKLAFHELERTRPSWRTESGITNKTVNYIIRGRSIRLVPYPTASIDATFIQATAPTSGMVANDTWYNTTDELLYKYVSSTWTATANASLGVLTLEVYRNPMERISSTSSEFEIPEEYQRDLIYWVLHEAYKKQDADTFSQEKSDYYLARFIQVFGDYVPAKVRVNQMENPRSITIRPFGYESATTQILEDDDWP